MLADLKEYIKKLGLECIEYIYEGEIWYAIRSNYVAPVELEAEEEAILAVIISLIEDTKQQKIEINAIKKKLILGKYCSEYQIKNILNQLEQLAYIQKKKQIVSYGPRLLLELTENARKHIAQETKRIIV